MSQIKITRLAVLPVLIFMSIFGIAQDSPQKKGITIGHIIKTLDSEINSKNYKLYVNLPGNYDKNKDKTYPVLYVLDGQWDFANVVTTYNNIQYDGSIPELLIIGISYGGENPDYMSLRANDMTPTVLPHIKNSGDAKIFTEVLRKEIIPFIDKEYRTSKENRTLMGNSFGGLFTHYTLFNANDLFSNYIICNPSLWYDNELAFTYEKEFANNNTDLRANAFFVWGSLDDVKRHEKMAKQIESHQYNLFDFKSNTEEGYGHTGAKSGGYADGLLHSFKRKNINIPEKELQKYTGNYEMGPGQEISIIIHDGHLAVKEFNGVTNIPIYTISKDEFSLRGSYNTFEFNKDENEKVISLTVQPNKENTITLKKTK